MKIEQKYKNFIIILDTVEKEYTWTIKRLDGSTLEESADTFKLNGDALDDAKAFIDDWYKA